MVLVLVYGSYIQRWQIWGSRFLAVTLMMCECWYMGHTYRGGKSGGHAFWRLPYDGVNVGIWVIHTEVANLGVTLFGGSSYDGVCVCVCVFVCVCVCVCVCV